MSSNKGSYSSQAEQEAERAWIQDCARNGIAIKPTAKFLAMFVTWQRRVMGWKQETLASFASVSLSTVQRIERGEVVRDISMDRVAVALGYDEGDFTRPRVPLPEHEAAAASIRSMELFSDRVAVDVSPITKQRQIRSLANSECYLVDTARLGAAFEQEGAALVETMDFVSFVISDLGPSKDLAKVEPVSRRALYRQVLGEIKQLEIGSRSVALGGTYTAKTSHEHLPQAQVAVIAFFPLATDPAAAKRTFLLLPKEIEMTYSCLGSM